MNFSVGDKVQFKSGSKWEKYRKYTATIINRGYRYAYRDSSWKIRVIYYNDENKRRQSTDLYTTETFTRPRNRNGANS